MPVGFLVLVFTSIVHTELSRSTTKAVLPSGVNAEEMAQLSLSTRTTVMTASSRIRHGARRRCFRVGLLVTERTCRVPEPTLRVEAGAVVGAARAGQPTDVLARAVGRDDPHGRRSDTDTL
jgi:hypothetical protein